MVDRANDGNQIMGARPRVQITAKAFSAKFKSKWEVFSFL